MSSSAFKPFRAAQPGDSRSPCPALNALANHSYLPHDGKDIPLLTLARALQDVYNISVPFAWVFAIGSFLICGKFKGSGFGTRLTFSLHSLAQHGVIEHDGSIAHANARPGQVFAPVDPDPVLLAELLAEGSSSAPPPYTDSDADDSMPVTKEPTQGVLTLQDFAHARFRRDKSLSAPLDFVHGQIALGEVALTLQTFGGPRSEVPRAWIQQWFGEYRLPDGWTPPAKPTGLISSFLSVTTVKKEVARWQRYE